MAADRRLPLVALLVAQALSVTGNRIALLAIPWFVLQTTGSATQTGLAVAVNTVPAVAAGLLAGPLIERVGFRLTSTVADLASGLTIATIPLLHANGVLTVPLLLGLVFLGALLDAPGETARRALLPDLAAHAGFSIDRATSLHETTYRTTQLLGAPLGGLLIGTIGSAPALFVDAATFFVSALLVGVLVRSAPAPASAEPPDGYGAQLSEGWRFLWHSPLLRSIVVLFIVVNMLEVALTQVLLPVLSERVYQQPVVLGLLIGAVGGGALVGVGLHAAFAERFSRRAVLLPALMLAGAPKFLLLATFPSPAIGVIGMLLLSIAMGAVNPISGAMEYQLIPRAMRGRIFGLLGVAFIGAAPIGAVGAGVLSEVLGVRSSLLIGAAMYLGVTLVPIFHPLWRDLDHLTPEGEGEDNM